MKFSDLFCGIGGSSYGAIQAGLTPHLLVDHDDVCGNELPKQLRGFFFKSDLSSSDDELWHKLSESEVLLCSPPCQAFSTLVSKNRVPVGRDLDHDFARTISCAATVAKRELVMVENVPQFLKTKMAQHIIRRLRSGGYYVECGVYDAADFGVPQRRRRAIILASKRPFKIKKVFPQVHVREAFSDLPCINTEDPLHYSTRRHSRLVAERIKAIPKNGGSRYSLPEHLQLACHKRSNGFHDVYGRMSWEGPSPTITSGCTNPSKGRFLHPDEDRSITLREAARLQTLPDDLVLCNTKSVEARARMIGNAFPSTFVTNLIKSAIG